MQTPDQDQPNAGGEESPSPWQRPAADAESFQPYVPPPALPAQQPLPAPPVPEPQPLAPSTASWPPPPQTPPPPYVQPYGSYLPPPPAPADWTNTTTPYPWAPPSDAGGVPPWGPPSGFPVGHPDGPWPAWAPPGYPNQKRRRRGTTAASTLGVLVMLFAIVVAYLGQGGRPVAVPAPQTTAPRAVPSATAPANTSQTNTAALTSGVVLIDTTVAGGGAAGTGMILTAEGKILTNYHVVEKSTTISVTVADTGDKYTATVIGFDKAHDVALLQLKNAKGLPTVKLDKQGLAIGAGVTAVGNAGGKGELVTVTGKVTALRQTITVGDEFTNISHDLSNLIQTSAPVEPGDSGGPMYDSQGEVLGMTTAGSISNRSGNAPVMTYAIPIADALRIVAQIESGVETSTTRIGRPAFLGLSLAMTKSGTPQPGTVVASVVAGGPAATAGITAGSTITEIDGKPIVKAGDVSDALSSLNPGEKVQVAWTDSSGNLRSATVTLGTSPTN